MATRRRCLRLLLQLLVTPWAVRGQDNGLVYIDTVAGHDELSTCAIDVLSTIVRAQYSGCGVDGAVTSHSCFCTDSSSIMSSYISAGIIMSCDRAIAPAQVSSAEAVFGSYCALTETYTTRSSSRSTATPRATATQATVAVTGATATPTSTAATREADTSSGGSSSTAAIAAGVVVPVVVIALALAAWLLFRKRRRATPARDHASQAPDSSPGDKAEKSLGKSLEKSTEWAAGSTLHPASELSDHQRRPPSAGMSPLELSAYGGKHGLHSHSELATTPFHDHDAQQGIGLVPPDTTPELPNPTYVGIPSESPATQPSGGYKQPHAGAQPQELDASEVGTLG